MPMDPAVVGAVASLSGVLVGGAITAASNVWLDVRREKAAEGKQQRADAAELQKVSRLLSHELASTQSAIQIAIKGGRWHQPPAGPVEDAWRNHQATMAGALSLDDWIELSTAFQYSTLVPEHFRSLSSSERMMDDDGKRLLHAAIDELTKGIKVLRRYL
jgi:hypothetical protein